MDLKIGAIIGLVIAAILIAALLPTAMTQMYTGLTKDTDFRWDNGVESGSAGANDTATFAIAKLLPLFLVIGGLVVMIGVGVKEFT